MYAEVPPRVEYRLTPVGEALRPALSLALELEPLGVRVRLVLPGSSPETPFGQNAQALMRQQGVTIPEAYADFAGRVFARMAERRSGPVTRSVDVAEAIWRAVSDRSSPVRQPAGADAEALAGSH